MNDMHRPINLLRSYENIVKSFFTKMTIFYCIKIAFKWPKKELGFILTIDTF